MTPARAILLGALAAAALAACGEQAAGVSAAPAKRSIALTISFDSGAGKVMRGTLSCRRGRQRATGVARPAARSCSRVRRLAAFLTTPPPRDRVCTEIYGGSETARVTGSIDGQRVSRRFSRRNGCEITDYNRIARAFAR